jgi:hypothetical protein
MSRSRLTLADFRPGIQEQIVAQLHPAKVKAAPIERPAEKPITDIERRFTGAGLPQPETELIFARPRRWRFDYAWPQWKIALEVEGAVWVQGRHTRGSGFVKDMEKYNAAVLLGWRVVRCVPKDVTATKTLEMLRQLLR